MVKRTLLIYLVAELVALIGLIWAVGLGWTLVILAASLAAGTVLAATQIKHQVAQIKRKDPRTAAADGALVGLGTALVLIPGVVSTAAGALMLAPPTRGAMRPVAGALLTRGITRRIGTPRRHDYIDGEVIGEINEDAVALTR